MTNFYLQHIEDNISSVGDSDVDNQLQINNITQTDSIQSLSNATEVSTLLTYFTYTLILLKINSTAAQSTRTRLVLIRLIAKHLRI